LNMKETLERLAQLIRALGVRSGPQSGPASGTRSTVETLVLDSVFFFYDDLGGMNLGGRDVEEYRGCVEALYAQVAGKEQVSRSAIETYVQRAVLTAIDPKGSRSETDFETRLGSVIEKLKDELKAKPILWEVHFQVEGLDTKALPVTFGGCEFYCVNDAYLAKLVQRTNSVIASLVEGPSREQAKRLNADEMRKLDGRTGVSTMVLAVDFRAAQAAAEKQVRLTVDMLNFYANLGNQPLTQLIFLDGVKPGVAEGFMFSEAPPSMRTNLARVGPMVPFSFKAEFEAAGLSRVSTLLLKPNRSVLEDKILSALQWAGRASVEQRKGEAFLLFAIALEALVMSGNDKAEITEKLAIRTAHLVIKNPKSRVQAYKDLKTLYGIRSKIVHSGSEDVTGDDLARIRFFVQRALLTVLCTAPFSKMADEAEFVAWVHNCMLGAAQVPEA
jgi:hypothetical protein